MKEFKDWTLSSDLLPFTYTRIKVESYKDFSLTPYHSILQISDEITYASLVIQQNSEILERFFEFESSFSAHILSGDYIEANRILEQIDVDFGYSVWSIDQRLAILNTYPEIGDIEAFLKQIKQQAGNTYILWYTRNQNIKMAMSGNPNQIRISMQGRINNFNIQDGSKILLNYKIAGVYPDQDSMHNVRYILYYSSSFSLIDMATTLRDLAFYYGDLLTPQSTLGSHAFTGALKILRPEITIRESIFAINDKSVMNTISMMSQSSKIEQIYNDLVRLIEYRFKRTLSASLINACLHQLFGGHIHTKKYRENQIAAGREALRAFDKNLLSKSPIFLLLDAALPENNAMQPAIDSVLYKKLSIEHQILALNIEKAIEKLVDYYLNGDLSIDNLPLLSAFDAYDKYRRGNDIATENILIFLHIAYSYHGNATTYNRLRDELDSYLFKNGRIMPSEATLANSTRQIYYLENICVSSIIDIFYKLSTYEDTIEERIRCLLKLININPVSKENYESEIISLFTLAIQNESIRAINASKIRVDKGRLVSSLARQLRGEHGELLSKISQDVLTEAENNLQQIIRVQASLKDFSKSIDEDSLTVMIRMFNIIREQYLNNHQFGMDQILGTNIRHGIFHDRIFFPMISNGIVLNKNDISRASIIASWSTHDRKDSEKLEKYLLEFTQDAAKIVDEFKEKYVRVKNSHHIDGMFFVENKAEYINTLIGLISKGETVEDFIKVVFDLINTALHENVVLMRRKLHEELENQLNRKIDVLQARLKKICDSYNVDQRFHAIKTEMSQIMQEIDKWFSLETSISIRQAYTPDESCDIALKILESLKPPSNTLKVAYSNIHTQYSFAVHQAVVSILLILLDNSLKYSHDGEIHISIEGEGAENIALTYRTPLNGEESRNKLEIHWKKLQSDIKCAEISTYYDKRSGTGLARIYSLISLSNEHKFEMLVRDNTIEFGVQMSLSTADRAIQSLEGSS